MKSLVGIKQGEEVKTGTFLNCPRCKLSVENYFLKVGDGFLYFFNKCPVCGLAVETGNEHKDIYPEIKTYEQGRADILKELKEDFKERGIYASNSNKPLLYLEDLEDWIAEQRKGGDE